MPGGDRTGPMGAGPRTGRAAGFCAGYGVPGYANPHGNWGYGFGFGRGFGRGMGRGFGRGGGWGGFGPGWGGSYNMPAAPGFAGYPGDYPENEPYGYPMSEEDEIKTLKSQEKFYANAIKKLSQRIEELEKQKNK